MTADREPTTEGRFTMLDPRILDPESEIVARDHLSGNDVAQVVEVLEAMHRWRETERAMSEASQRYMKLGDTDMRALRFLVACRSQDTVATPSSIAQHLGISTASTTKLLDRLAKGGHVTRHPHPSDRRSLAIEITEETRISARESVGRTHARRFQVAASLTAAERDVVIRFFAQLVETAEMPGHPHA
ncbi:MarR family transcriptional regulator [Microbacterium excoecariae]|uniref:MarR family transcriptional regulator n=1 Tax=Microbacterium excoecariae TaxID=2715210 RepID=UPI001408B7E7